MNDSNFRDRATAFSVGAASLVLILALLATGVAHKLDAPDTVVRYLAIEAVLLAVICGIATGLATMRALAPIAAALDHLTDSVRIAASGDLSLRRSHDAELALPELTRSLDALLGRVQTSIDNIQQLALHDPVTELPNRLHFRRIVERHLRSVRGTDRQGALLFIDLDRFKAVNDSLGHAQGDLLLGMFAARMRVLIAADSPSGQRAPEITLARLAGDEFTLLLPDIQGLGDASRMARRILRALEEPLELGGQSIVVGASIGIACFPADGKDYDSLMRSADTAMYHAKEQGRNQFHFYAAAMNERARDRLLLEVQLREALAKRQFSLHFQPQVQAETGRLVSAEALIRWHHPETGHRMPGSFIAAAEETGLIVDIGRWVLAESTQTLARWHRLGLDYRLSVNVSPRQIARPDFVSHLQTCLEESGAPAHLLELEITESLVMSNDPDTIDKIAQMRALGVSIAIDDFGTGYSNLARLQKLPIDRLKIDRSLVQDIACSADARTIVHAIVSLCHGLGYECVAEGVETPDQVDILTIVGCELLQGFTIAKPADEASFLAWAEERRYHVG